MFKIREARKRAKVTQEELADALDINRATLSKYETGVIEPTLSQLVRIAEELGISPTVLLPDSMIESWKSGESYGSEHSIQEILEYGYRISADEIKLVNAYWNLNRIGQQKAVEAVEIIAGNPRYQRKSIREAADALRPPEDLDTTPPEKPPESPREG